MRCSAENCAWQRTEPTLQDVPYKAENKTRAVLIFGTLSLCLLLCSAFKIPFDVKTSDFLVKHDILRVFLLHLQRSVVLFLFHKFIYFEIYSGYFLPLTTAR